MQYRTDRYGNPISQLGFGCMRFAKKGAAIDYEKAQRQVLLAMERGVNYCLHLPRQRGVFGPHFGGK